MNITKPVIGVLLGLLLLFQYQLWFSAGGVQSINHLKAQIATQSEHNAQLAAKNQVLIADVKNLQQGKNAVEERARNELGMIKRGEVFYRIV